MNPCRCGQATEPGFACRRQPNERCMAQYQARLSGPLLDRIDLVIEVPSVAAADMMLPPPVEGSAEVAARVAAARRRQAKRYADSGLPGSRPTPPARRRCSRRSPGPTATGLPSCARPPTRCASRRAASTASSRSPAPLPTSTARTPCAACTSPRRCRIARTPTAASPPSSSERSASRRKPPGLKSFCFPPCDLRENMRNSTTLAGRRERASMRGAVEILDLGLLWAQTRGDPRICIAVLDGPVDEEHPCFRGAHLTHLPTTADPACGGGAASSHGTHVASIIFGQHDGTVRGVAPGCADLIAPIFADQGSLSACSQLDIARAVLQAVEAGAHVINISAGQFTTASEPDPLLARAIQHCADRNVLIVAAVGNDGCECIHVPAAASLVLSVGAMDANGAPMDMSNWGLPRIGRKACWRRARTSSARCRAAARQGRAPRASRRRSSPASSGCS